MSLTFAETNNKGQRGREEREVWWSRPASDTPTGTSVGVFCGETGHALDRKMRVFIFLEKILPILVPLRGKAVYFCGKKLRAKNFPDEFFSKKKKKEPKKKKNAIISQNSRWSFVARGAVWGPPSSARTMPSARSQISGASEGERCLNNLILPNLTLTNLTYPILCIQNVYKYMRIDYEKKG